MYHIVHYSTRIPIQTLHRLFRQRDGQSHDDQFLTLPLLFHVMHAKKRRLTHKVVILAERSSKSFEAVAGIMSVALVDQMAFADVERVVAVLGAL